MCYCNIIRNKPFLYSLLNTSKEEFGKAIRLASELEIQSIVEILYNSYDVPLTLEGRKILIANKFLIKYFFKTKVFSYRKTRAHLISHRRGVQLVLSLILKAILEDAVLEACMTD